MKKILVLALFIVLGTALQPRLVFAEEGAAPAPPAASADSGKKEGDKKEEGGSKKPDDVSGGRFAGDPVFVHLDPMVLPVITEDGAEQLVTLQIAVEVKNFDVADNVHTNMPLVRDALMRALYGGLGNGALRNGMLVDVSRIKAKATAALNPVIGAENIRDVLIEAVAQRRL